MPSSTGKGIHNQQSQLNRKGIKVKTANLHRKEIMNYLLIFI